MKTENFVRHKLCLLWRFGCFSEFCGYSLRRLKTKIVRSTFKPHPYFPGNIGDFLPENELVAFLEVSLYVPTHFLSKVIL